MTNSYISRFVYAQTTFSTSVWLCSWALTLLEGLLPARDILVVSGLLSFTVRGQTNICRIFVLLTSTALFINVLRSSEYSLVVRMKFLYADRFYLRQRSERGVLVDRNVAVQSS